MRKGDELVCDVGVNDAKHVVFRKASGDKQSWMCPYYRVWRNMLLRCYRAKGRRFEAAYEGCSVAEPRHTFSNFMGWMEKQDWQGKHLDKDILVPGNKIYSEDLCVFVDQKLNSFLIKCVKQCGDWPMGVSWHKRDQEFRAECSNPFTGKRERLGSFLDPMAAHKAWKKRKHELACQYADIQTDERVAHALRTRFAPN